MKTDMDYKNDKGFIGHRVGLQVARTQNSSTVRAEVGLGDAGTKSGLHIGVHTSSRRPPVRMQYGPLQGHMYIQSKW